MSDNWPPELVGRVARDRAARKAVRQRRSKLFAAVSEAMFHHDPIGINFGGNSDEYDAEAGTVIHRLVDCESTEDVERILHEEFVIWFSAENAGAQAGYTELAGKSGDCGPHIGLSKRFLRRGGSLASPTRQRGSDFSSLARRTDKESCGD
jgi:hypothetical protein